MKKSRGHFKDWGIHNEWYQEMEVVIEKEEGKRPTGLSSVFSTKWMVDR